MKLAALGAVISILTLGTATIEPAAELFGGMVARFDLARGHHKSLAAGLLIPYFPEYQRIKRERYGIETVIVAGCVIDPIVGAYIKGYNTVSQKEAKRRFGRDVSRGALEAAAAEYRSNPPTPLR